MNGNGAAPGADLDALAAAQSERLAKKADVVKAASNDEEVQTLAVLSATLLSNQTVRFDMPENRDHYKLLLGMLIEQGLERAAAAGQQIGAEEAVKAIAANPRVAPLMWFQQKFGRAVRK